MKYFVILFTLCLFSVARGDVTVSNEVQLQAALNGKGVSAGDTIWLRGGVYQGAFTSRVEGKPNAPVTIRSYPGEWGVLNRNSISDNQPLLTIKGEWVIVRDAEFTNSATGRTYRDGKAANIKGDGPMGINVRAANVRLINLIVHDQVSSAIGLWEEAAESEVYGCVIVRNGISKHDHGVYAQGRSEGFKLIRNNIILDNYGTGISLHAARNRYPIAGYILDGNVIADNGRGEPDHRNWTLGTATNLFERVYVRRNLTYQSDASGVDVQLKYQSPSNTVLFESNVFGGGQIEINDGAPVIARHNTFLGKMARLWFKDTGKKHSTGKQWPNSRHVPNSRGADWFMVPNEHEAGRFQLAVYNWARYPFVDIDASKFLAVGARYRVQKAENWHGEPVASDVYRGGDIRIPMVDTTLANPVDDAPIPARSTFPEFAAFVIQSE